MQNTYHAMKKTLAETPCFSTMVNRFFQAKMKKKDDDNFVIFCFNLLNYLITKLIFENNISLKTNPQPSTM